MGSRADGVDIHTVCTDYNIELGQFKNKLMDNMRMRLRFYYYGQDVLGKVDPEVEKLINEQMIEKRANLDNGKFGWMELPKKHNNIKRS